MTALGRLLLAVVLVFGLALPSQAREVIRAFASDVTLRVDGSVRVIETVDVEAEGDAIKRGIYRDIPTVMLGPSGNKIRVGLDVESVTRAGAPEDFRVERMGNFQRIWIGNPDVLLNYGEHRYVITYVMERMARPFAEHDELYWNATGNYWDFPILKSVARVTLPDGAVISELSAYTGEAGSTETAVTVTRTSDSQATFRTQRALTAGEGMTFAVSFQKGIIAYPAGMDELAQNVSDLREVWLPVLAVLVLLGYNLIAWWRVGRDPPKGTIIPLFHPPKDFSPGLTHYVQYWGMFQGGGWTAFTAAICNLGVKGLVTINNIGDALSVKLTGKSPQTPLPVGEEVLFSYLQSTGGVTVDKASGPTLNTKRGEFTAAIARENRKVWFSHNAGYVVFSFVLAFAMMGAMVLLDVLEPVWLIGAFIGGIVVGIIGSLVFSFLSKGGMRLFMVVLWLGIVGFNMGGGILESFSSVTVNSAAIAAGSLILISIVFAALMRAPTIQGRKVMDEIEGFKLYLETAEKNRLNMSGEPPMTKDRFERILPYAIAMGVEKPWTEHFEGELARNAVSDVGSDYQPNWYSGRTFSSGSLASAVTAASSGMAAAMVAAQPVQASSSGSSSSGGGSSGGGGGGGGGGGW